MIKIIVIIILILLLILLLYLGFKRIKFSGGYTDVQSYNDYFEGRVKIHQTSFKEFNNNSNLLWGLLKYHPIREQQEEQIVNTLSNIKTYVWNVCKLKGINVTKFTNFNDIYDCYKQLDIWFANQNKENYVKLNNLYQQISNSESILPNYKQSKKVKQIVEKVINQYHFNGIDNLRQHNNDYDVLIIDGKYIFSSYNSVFQLIPTDKVYNINELNQHLEQQFTNDLILKPKQDDKIIIPKNGFYNTIRFESNNEVLVDDSSLIGVTCYPIDPNYIDTQLKTLNVNVNPTNEIQYSVTSDLHGSLLSLVSWLIQSGRLQYLSVDDNGYNFKIIKNNSVRLICLGDIVNYKNVIESSIDGITYNIQLMFNLIDLVFNNNDVFIRGNHEMMLFHQYQWRFNDIEFGPDITKNIVETTSKFITDKNIIALLDSISDIKTKTLTKLIDKLKVNQVQQNYFNQSINKLRYNIHYPSVFITPQLLLKKKYNKYCNDLIDSTETSVTFVKDYYSETKGNIQYLFTHQSLINMISDNICTTLKSLPITIDKENKLSKIVNIEDFEPLRLLMLYDIPNNLLDKFKTKPLDPRDIDKVINEIKSDTKTLKSAATKLIRFWIINADLILNTKIINIHGHVGSLFSHNRTDVNVFNYKPTETWYDNEQIMFKYNTEKYNNGQFNEYTINPNRYRVIQQNFISNSSYSYLPLSIDSSFVYMKDNNSVLSYYDYNTDLSSVYPIMKLDSNFNIQSLNIYQCHNKVEDNTIGQQKMLLYKWLNILYNYEPDWNSYDECFNLIQSNKDIKKIAFMLITHTKSFEISHKSVVAIEIGAIIHKLNINKLTNVIFKS